MKPFIIGIAGPSCSGKTTLAKQLASECLDADIISLDDYWRPEYEPPLVGRWKNRELPDNIDFDHLYRDLRDLKEGRAVVAPVWIAKEKRFEQRTIAPHLTIIAEGYLLYHDRRISDLCDLKTFLDIPEEEMVKRRIARNRSGRPQRHEYYRDVVAAEYRKYGMPAMRDAEMVLDGTASAEENSFRIRDYLCWTT